MMLDIRFELTRTHTLKIYRDCLFIIIYLLY